jgi:hypothetical protein
MLKKDNLPFGLILGLIAPLFGLLLFYFLKFFPTYSLTVFLTSLPQEPLLINSVASLSMFVNVVFLTLFLNKRRDKTAIGIFIATVIYGAAALIFKFVVS